MLIVIVVSSILPYFVSVYEFRCLWSVRRTKGIILNLLVFEQLTEA